MSDADVKEAVRERYASAALRFSTMGDVACCEPDPNLTNSPEGPGFGVARYEALTGENLPDTATLASLGCGNPTAVARLEEGETVLDLGAGAGLDVFLSSKRVGVSGTVYGLDMTDEMLELARRNQAELRADNVEFLDKPQVFREAHRVLKPGGRFAVTDVVTTRLFSADELVDMAAWSGCIAGALSEGEYLEGLGDAGFRDVEVEVTHSLGPDVVSAIIRATA